MPVQRPDWDFGALHDVSSADGRVIPDAMVQKAAQLVDLMKVLDRIQVWRDEQKRRPGGRPETFPMRALLVAMVLCVTTDQPLLVTRIRDVLFIQISAAMRAALGVPDPPGRLDRRGWAACYRNTRSRLHALLDLVDPSVLPKNRRLDHEAFLAAVELRRSVCSAEELKIRRERLTWLVNQILEASFRMLPRAYRRRWRGSVAVDATVVPTFARQELREPLRRGMRGKDREVLVHSADPDAAYYHREPDDRDAGAALPRPPQWAYELSIVVAGSDDPDEEPFVLSLVVGMAPLHRPGHDPGPNAIVALSSVHARGHPANWLAADRAYTSAKAENFQLPARSSGYRLTLDYTLAQLGVQASFGGFLQVEGDWYCPAIPEVLINATRDYRNGLIDGATYRARLEERWGYRARAKARPDAEGHIRVYCPAASYAIARCELKPTSLTLTTTRGKLRIPVRSDVRADPPPACTQTSLTIPPEAGAKFSQELLFGSPEWEAVYATLRNSVEGFNGFVKDGSREALDDPERRRLRGVAAQSVLVAFLLFAANLRKIGVFVAEKAAIAAGTMRRLPRRRRTRSLETWRPKSPSIAPNSGPDPPISS
jgi:hypothetical protein